MSSLLNCPHSVIGLVQIIPLDRVSFKLNGGDLHLGFLRSEAVIEEEGSGDKQGQQEAKKAEGEGSGCGRQGLWLRLRLLRMKVVTTSRGTRKQRSSGGGRCDSKDGRGGWVVLEGKWGKQQRGRRLAAAGQQSPARAAAEESDRGLADG
ncbi:hypothetical protein GW17_00020477, partial [Ensete ventricosum]